MITVIVALAGAVSGVLLAVAAFGNMRNGRMGNMVQAATFLQTEVARLQKEIKDKDEEIATLHRIIERRSSRADPK